MVTLNNNCECMESGDCSCGYMCQCECECEGCEQDLVSQEDMCACGGNCLCNPN